MELLMVNPGLASAFITVCLRSCGMNSKVLFRRSASWEEKRKQEKKKKNKRKRKKEKSRKEKGKEKEEKKNTNVTDLPCVSGLSIFMIGSLFNFFAASYALIPLFDFALTSTPLSNSKLTIMVFPRWQAISKAAIKCITKKERIGGVQHWESHSERGNRQLADFPFPLCQLKSLIERVFSE